MLNRYISFVLRRPVTVLLILLIVTIILGTGIWKIKFDNSYDVMMPQKDSLYLFNEETKKIYGNLDNFIISTISSNKNLWSAGFFRDFDNLVTDLEEFKEYNESLETARLEKLNVYDKETKEKTLNSLVEYFNEDPAYQRAVKREFSKITSGSGSYSLEKVKIPDAVSEADSSVKNSDKKISRWEFRSFKKRMAFLNDLKKAQLIDDIISPLTGKDISGTNDTLQSVDIVDKDENGRRILPSDDKSFKVFKERLRKNPAFARGLFAEDKSGNITDFALVVKFINIKNHDDITRESWKIIQSYTDINSVIQGVPVINKYLSDYMNNDLINFLPPMFAVIILVFFLNFRSARGVFLPLATLVLSDIWVLGLMGHLGFKLTMLGVSLPALIVAVGSSYSIHVVNQYYIDIVKLKGMEKAEGLRISMSHISITVFLAALTTFLGFASLLTNQVTAIRDWGLFSALGVLVAVIISTSMIPAAMMLLSVPEGTGGEDKNDALRTDFADRFVSRVAGLSINNYGKVIVVTLILLLISIAGAMNMKVETSILSYFKENDYVRKSHRIIGDKLGGSFGTKIIIDSGTDDGVKDPEFLRTIDNIREWLQSEKISNELHVGRTDAFTDIIKTMNMAMNNDKPEFYKIPENKKDIMDYLEIYSGDDDNFDGRFDEFESYIDPGYRSALIFVKHNDGNKILGTEEFDRIHKSIDLYLRNNLDKKYSYSISGVPSIIVRLSGYVISGQANSLIFSLLTVVFIVIILFKNWKAGLLSMIPMSTAIIMNFGIMGWCGINLDYATSIIACLVIGIGVDDTIHFLNTYRHFMDEEHNIDRTITRTLKLSGKAIIYTSLALIFGFTVLTISNFKPIIFFGLLCASTMVTTTLGALIVLPAVIKATGADLSESRSNSLFWRIFNIGKLFAIEASENSADAKKE
ncbi:MAG TPA: efflux RND transporter permease subunit [Spirochaetota bacterium]|nr:efflux RND transporter permease subunit [Spirochaetota bacterium]HPS85127.1 efflux RND transporter permease subunit [Spirochaetota bacterium]